MKEKDLHGKACIAPVVVAGLGMVGLGLVSDGIVAADTTSVTDAINVTVSPSCTFNSTIDKTYSGSAANGMEVDNFNESGVHEFSLFCNDNNGYVVTAKAYDLTATGIEDVISYTDNYTHTGVDSMWTAVIASDTAGVTVASPVPAGNGGTIVSADSNTTAAGATFTATYSAYVGTATPAGTYTGTIVYTLTASGASNSGGSNSGSGDINQNNNGENGDNSGSDVMDNTDNNGDLSDSGPNNINPDNANTGAPNNTPNNTQSATPLALNNTYNTYNVTNNSGSGTSMPATTSTQGATSGSSNGATSNNNAGSSDNYEKPLGVVTTTATSADKNSGIDLMPVVVVGAVLAVAGVAAVVVAQRDKDE